MAIVVFGMRVIEVLFFAGIVGSTVVVLITSFEDMHDLLEKNEELPAEQKTSQ